MNDIPAQKDSSPRTVKIEISGVTGFKKDDLIILKNEYSANLTVKSVSHKYEGLSDTILCDVLECEPAQIEYFFPDKSTVETPDKSVKSYTLNDIPNQKDISLTSIQIAIPEAKDNIVLIHADNPLVNTTGEITVVNSDIDTVFVNENYLVYSGIHAINKK
jgi:hypothetical protein